MTVLLNALPVVALLGVFITAVGLWMLRTASYTERSWIEAKLSRFGLCVVWGCMVCWIGLSIAVQSVGLHAHPSTLVYTGHVFALPLTCVAAACGIGSYQYLMRNKP